MTTCPPADRWQAYLADKLSAEEDAVLTAHAEGCSACTDVLSRLARTDLPKTPQASGQEQAPPRALIERLRGLWNRWDAEEPAPAAEEYEETWPKIDGYEVRSVLGSGGMGVVYEARQTALNRTVALKTIRRRSPKALRSDDVQRFLFEAEAVAKVEDPAIVRIYEVGRDVDGSPYMALELCPGGSLAARLTSGPLAPREAAQMLHLLALGLGKVHARGIIHRDITPNNILAGTDGVWKLTDFGLAKLIEKPASLTHTGEVRGTPLYMAPERFGKKADLDARSDVYSLGAVLYETLTGEPPFRGPRIADVVYQTIHADPVPLRKRRVVSRDLETICLKCLHKDPRHRYATAQALADDLQRFLTNEPIAARPWPWWRRLAHGVRRRPGLSATAALVLILLLGTLAAWWLDRGARQAFRASVATARVSLHRTFDKLEEQAMLVPQSTKAPQAFQELRGLDQDLRSAAGLYEKFHQDDPRDATIQEELADIEVRLGCLATLLLRDTAEALTRTARAQALLAELAAAYPAEKVYAEKLANTKTQLGILYATQNLPDQAVTAHHEAIRIRQALLQEAGDDADSVGRLVRDWAWLGMLHGHRGQLTESEAAFANAIEAQQKCVAAAPADFDAVVGQAGLLQGRAAALAALGSVQQAEETFAQALKMLDRVVGPDLPRPVMLSAAQKLGLSKPNGAVLRSASIFMDLLMRAEGRPNMTTAITFYTQLLAAHPEDLESKRQLARTLYYEAMFAFATKESEAPELVRRAADLYVELQAANSGDKRQALELAQLCVYTAMMFDRQQQYQAVGPWCERAQAALDQAGIGDPPKPGAKSLRADFHQVRAMVKIRQEHYVDAVQDLQRTLALQASPQEPLPTLYATTVAKARGQMYKWLRSLQYDKATAQADALAGIPGIAGEALYDGACVFGVVAAKTKEPQVHERYAAQAVELLRRAFATGFGKDRYQKMSGIIGDPVQHMQHDPDLAALRDRTDYCDLLADLTHQDKSHPTPTP
jgi:tetratricopeptide (TPR) repeat protein